MCIRDSNYRGNGPEQRTNGHPNDHNYYGNRYHPNYQYNRGPGGNPNRSDDRRRVNFIRGPRQSNHRRYSPNWRPNCYYQVSNNNNNPPAEGRNDEPPRSEDNHRQEPNTNQNNSGNWVTVHENPGFSILHDTASNDEGPRTAQVNSIRACLLYTSRCV